VPRPWSTSASLATTSTTSETRNTGVASQSTSSLLIANNQTTTNTGPVDEVTPWELAPGPEGSVDYNAAAPPSPTRGNSKKFSSLFKSKHEPKASKHTGSTTSPDNPNPAPLPDIPMDLLATYGTSGIPPIALQRSLASSIKSNSQQSERSFADSSKQHLLGQTQGGYKWSRPGNKSGKDRKDSTSSSNVGVGERTRQLPLTGPLEEVAPWEMDPPLDDGVEKTITNRAVKRIAVTSSPPMSPTIEMWKAQKSAGLVKGSREDAYNMRGDGRSMSSSALPLSRARANSVAASSEAGSMLNGERMQASTKGEEKAARIPHSRDGFGSNLSRGRSLTGQTATSSKSSLVRPASSAASAGHGAESIISIMNKAQIEEVLPWELYPIPKPIQRSTTAPSGMMGEERERDRKMVRIFFLNLLVCFFLGGMSVFFGLSYIQGLWSAQLSDIFPCRYSAHDCGGRA